MVENESSLLVDSESAAEPKVKPFIGVVSHNRQMSTSRIDEDITLWPLVYGY